MSTENQFIFRAECLQDVLNLLNLGKVIFSYILIKKNKTFPDVFVKFQSKQSMDEIKNHIKEVLDGHVMTGTLDLACNWVEEVQQQMQND